MRKRFIKITSVLLMIIMILSIWSVATLNADALQDRTYNFYSSNVSGDGFSDMANIARAQSGRTQGSFGYSEAWCADFVSDCAKIVGQSEAIPANGLVSSMYYAVINAGGYRVSSAQAGDLVFYYNESIKNWMHVGVMIDSETAISGNYWIDGVSYATTHGYSAYWDEYGSRCTAVFVRPNYMGRANINPPSNVWLEKNKDWYETNDTITLTAHADNADTYWISIYKDGQHIFTQQFSETLSFPANQYGGGDYYAWITAHNAAGDTDSSPISFLVISKPTDVQLNCDKSVIAIGETITFTMSSNTATNYYIGIDKDGTRIIGEQINSGKTYTFDESGSYSAYVTAWNSLGEIDSNIVRFTVFDSDTVKPNYNYKWINYITNDSFRINIEPTDNVGIKKVIVATWTQSDKSDLVWHDAHFNGVAWYYLDIIRADYSAWQNSLYHNVFYIYDYADNCLTVQCDQDYKIISDTGKSIPEGEYRIVTALDERKALHIENDSTEDKADVQISSNLTNSKQTFYLKYKNNGFYTIENSYSGNVIDVWNDTYVVGTNVVSHQYLGGANQEWMFKPTNDGYYAIVSHSNGQALDVQDFKTDDGSTVFVYTLKEPYEINQKWKLRRVIKGDMVNILSWKSENGIMKPTVQVTVDDKILIENIDYIVSLHIENNTLYAKISGVGNYCDSVSIEYQEPRYIIGDTNLDGIISIGDVTAIQRHLAELAVFNDEQLALADTNGDGRIDISDATYLQMYLAEYGVVLGKQ